MQVIVDGLLVTYERSGQGKKVVLLHGWGDRASGLHALQVTLAKNYEVIVPDLPGFGGTQAPKETWGLDDYVRFITHFLEKINCTEVYTFIGHSNGGALILRGVGRGMLAAQRLVLLASAGVRGEYKGRNRAFRYLAKAGKALTLPLPVGVKKKLRRKVYDAIGSDMLVAEHLQETFKRVVSEDVRAEAAKIVAPTLLIYGEMDRATPVRYGEWFHELIEGSTLEVLPGAGHFVHIDRPHEVTSAIEEFLR